MIKRVLTYICTAATLFALSGPVLAAGDAGPDAHQISGTADSGPASDVAVAASPVIAEPGVLEAGEAVVDAVKVLRNKEAAISQRLKVASLVGALAMLLLAGLRYFPSIDKRKRWIPWVLLALGAIIGVADQLVTGVGWAAAITALGPLLSQVYYQLVKQARPKAA